MKIPREAETGQEPLRSLEPKPAPCRLYRSRALIGSSLIVLAMAMFSSWCHGQLAFKVSGTVVKTKFAGDGKIQGSESSRFEMVVSGESWQLKDFTEGEKYREITCDGTNIFNFDPWDITPLPPNFHSSTKTGAKIEPAPIPSGGHTVEIPWFVYASGPVIRAGISNVPAPWLKFREDSNAHVYRATLDARIEVPCLPAAVTFTATRARVTNAADSRLLDTQGLIDVRQARQAFRMLTYDVPEGFIGGEYKVTSTTNIGGAEVPNGFSLTDYYAFLDNHPNEVYSGTNITVTRIEPRHLQPSKPGAMLFVFDYRFRNDAKNIQWLDYLSKTWVTSTQNVMLQKLFAQKLDPPDRSQFQTRSEKLQVWLYHASRWTSYWRYGLAFVIVLVPVIVVIAARRERE